VECVHPEPINGGRKTAAKRSAKAQEDAMSQLNAPETKVS
jgi:hypothetical protein